MADILSTLTANDAQQKIRGIAELGEIIPTYHYDDKGQNIRHYSLQDVEYILKNGTVTEPPIFDEDYQNWKCRVEGQSISGDDTVVITAIASHRELIVISVFLK